MFDYPFVEITFTIDTWKYRSSLRFINVEISDTIYDNHAKKL